MKMVRREEDEQEEAYFGCSSLTRSVSLEVGCGGSSTLHGIRGANTLVSFWITIWIDWQADPSSLSQTMKYFSPLLISDCCCLVIPWS